MVVEKRASGSTGRSFQENNQQSYAFDTHIRGATGRHRVYIHILSAGDTPLVRLYLYGMGANPALLQHLHEYAYSSPATDLNNSDNPLGSSGDPLEGAGIGENVGNVPQEITIWINGVEKTATLGDANSKGATMYDSTNDDWGVDGTTEWNTGELDLSASITWSVGEHYIEFRCADTGGRLLGNIFVN